MQSRVRNHRGVTLIEVMIALCVLLIVFMGLIQASLLSIDHNLRNAVRDEAVRIAAEAMTNLKSRSFNSAELAATGSATYTYSGHLYDGVDLDASVRPGPNPSRTFRNFSQSYTVKKEIQDTSDGNNKQVTVRVHYVYRTDKPVVYNINSVIVNPAALNQ